MNTLTAVSILLLLFAVRFLLPFGVIMLINRFNGLFAKNLS